MLLPTGVADAVFSVSVEVPAPESCEGENEQVAPAGKPEQARVTAPENAFTDWRVIEYVADCPGETAALPGFTAIEKSGSSP